MNIFNIKTPNSLIVLSVPVLGYLFAFMFELGFLKFYQVDYNFIQITPIQVVLGSFTAVIAFSILYVTSYSYVIGLPKFDVSNPFQKYKKENRDLLYLGVLLLVVALFISAINSQSKFLMIALIIPFIFLLIHLIIFGYYLEYRDWREAITAYFRAAEKNNRRSQVAKIPVHAELLYGTFFLLVLCAISYAVGYVIDTPAAKNGEPKIVLQTIQKTEKKYEHVVIRRQGDILLIKEYDSENKRYIDGFRTEPVDNQEFYQKALEFK